MQSNVQGKTSLHIVTTYGVQSQWYLGPKTMDPIKLSMESDTLCVILLGVSVYQRYTWISTSFIPWCLPLLKWYFMVLKGYFMFNFLMFYQIEVSLETFIQAVFRLTHILFAATSA